MTSRTYNSFEEVFAFCLTCDCQQDGYGEDENDGKFHFDAQVSLLDVMLWL